MATKKARAPSKFIEAPSPRPPSTKATPASRNQQLDSSTENVVAVASQLSTRLKSGSFIIHYPTIKKNGKPYELDLTFLLPLKNIAEALRDGHVAKLGPRPNPNTLLDYTKALRNGFVKFLIENNRIYLRLKDINTPVINEFEEWLNQLNGETARWSETTRGQRYFYFQTIFNELRALARWKEEISTDIRFAVNPWPERARNAKAKPIIDDDLMSRIRLSCITDIEKLLKRRDQFFQFIEETELTSNSKKSDGPPRTVRNRSPEQSKIYEIYKLVVNNPFIRHGDLSARHRSFLSKSRWTFTQLREMVFPTPRALVPFVILNTLAFAYNADTARGVLLRDFEYVHDLSTAVVWEQSETADGAASSERSDIALPSSLLVNAFKPRSGKRQPVCVPVDDAFDNPHFILRYVTEWTQTLRPFAPSGLFDKLFIFGGSTKFGISSFSGVDGLTSPSTWNYSLDKFRKEYSLQYFSLENIRPSVLDLAFRTFGGDIRLVSAEANHATVATTSRSYQGEGEKRRQYERLGTTGTQRDRWRETKGVIEPRDHPHGMDLNCATPGWTCADPFDSPFSPKGKLCSSYGICPICPLGGVDLNSPLSCAYTLGLLDAVNNAQQSMEPASWLNRWAPVKERLTEKWIPSFSRQAMTCARNIDIPKMPRPE
jgi:hypothetical protein